MSQPDPYEHHGVIFNAARVGLDAHTLATRLDYVLYVCWSMWAENHGHRTIPFEEARCSRQGLVTALEAYIRKETQDFPTYPNNAWAGYPELKSYLQKIADLFLASGTSSGE
mgnify:CR=1 FL=1